MNFGSDSSFNDVAISDNAISVDKKTAAARTLFTARIEGFNRHRGGLNATNEFGEEVLGSGGYGRCQQN